MKTPAMLIAMAAVCVGCAGSRFSFEDARQVKVGMTEAEVTDRLGRPYSVTTRGDTQVWVWSYASTFGGTRAVSFVFRDGKVQSVPAIPANF